MDEWIELAIWIALLLAAFGVIVLAVRTGYWIGYLDGRREGFKSGRDFAVRKMLETKQSDGYGSYN